MILSDFLENKLLDHILGTASYTPGSLYLALFTGDPGETDATTNEVSGGNYARVAISNNTTSFPNCSESGTPTKTLSVAVVFPTASAAWGTITHWAIYNAASGANNKLAQGAFSASRVVSTGQTPRVAAGSIIITASNSGGGGLTNYAKRKLLDLAFGNQSYTSPTAIYCSLNTAADGETLTEFLADTYDRPEVEFGAASGGVAANSNIESFTSAVITTGDATVTHYGLHDSVTVGNLLAYGPLSTSRAIAIGDTATAAVGAITVTLQ